VTTWLIATSNRHKAQEIGAILGDLGIELVTARDAGLALDVDEWGDTFATNAALKAVACASAAGGVAIADDSGIEIDAFGGAPGVRSARWAGRDGDDDANNAKLVAELARLGIEESAARYRCVIALAIPCAAWASDCALPPRSGWATLSADGLATVEDFVVATFSGVMEGRVERQPRGEGGFGYDPYFVLDDGRHLAELLEAEKNAISHRGAGLARMRAGLEADRVLAVAAGVNRG
jgi:XTP/dITP diphosphohydrolase